MLRCGCDLSAHEDVTQLVTVPCTVRPVPATHLFCSWKFVAVRLPHLFLPPRPCFFSESATLSALSCSFICFVF